MTRQEHIHRLFNELHRLLDEEADEVIEGIDMDAIAEAVDSAHHDFTCLTLEEIA